MSNDINAVKTKFMDGYTSSNKRKNISISLILSDEKYEGCSTNRGSENFLNFFRNAVPATVVRTSFLMPICFLSFFFAIANPLTLPDVGVGWGWGCIMAPYFKNAGIQVGNKMFYRINVLQLHREQQEYLLKRRIRSLPSLILNLVDTITKIVIT